MTPSDDLEHHPSAADVVWIADIDTEVCWTLLERRRVGRVGFVRGSTPWVLPVNHLVDDHAVVFRTDRASALGRLDDGDDIVFEVDDADADARVGWSVIVRGTVAFIDDDGEQRALRRRGLEPWAPGRKDRFVRIVPSSVTGRSISRRRRQPDGTFLPYMPPD